MSNYTKYLQSEHWSLLRGAKIQISPVCQRCGSDEEIEVHHKLYREKWTDAKLADLETLCHHCHTTHHAVELAKSHFTPKQIKKIIKPKREPIIEHRPTPIKPKTILPELRCVTWQNRKSVTMTKESYAWMAERGVNPCSSGWRERLVGKICPSHFFK